MLFFVTTNNRSFRNRSFFFLFFIVESRSISNFHCFYTYLSIFYFIFFMNIYIGNLSYRVRESDLRQVMEEYGTVDSVKLIVDRDTKKSKGFAFVEMSDDNEANQVIKELNGAEYEGRQMVVKEALPRK